jgi:iron complex outermembrane receptor protein
MTGNLIKSQTLTSKLSKITMAILALGLASQVTAVQSSEQGKAKENEGLEVIVVTATKREKNIQEVPISMTALSGARLERLGIKEVANLENSVPNLDFGNTHTNDNPAITIRGISASAGNIGFEAGVGVYIDGVYMGRNSSLNQPLTDIDMVEVLRGPQGTLFGKNTTVGALNIKTRRPSEEFEGAVQLEVGNFGLLRTRARVSGPLIDDTLLAKISVYTDDRDGFEVNLKEDASDALDENQHGMRGELLYKATDALEMSLRWDLSESDRKVIAWSVDENDKHGLSFEGNKPHVISQDDSDENRTIQGSSFTVDYDFGNGYSFTSITGLRDLDININGDQDFQAAERLNIVKSEAFEQFSQELRIASPNGRAFKYVAGLYYYQQDAKSNLSNIAIESFPVIGVDAGFVAGLGAPLGFPAWGAEADLYNTTTSAVDTTSTALFLDSSYDITDNLTLLVGIRYTNEDKELKYSQKGINLLIPSYAEFADERSDSETSPNIGLSYSVDADINIYAKVTRGFKSGGWNATSISSPTPFGPNPIPENVITPEQIEAMKFNPEELTNYEVGVKSELFDGLMRLNAAVFYIDYENMQLSVFKGLEGSVTTNAGESRSKGFEIEVEAVPFDNISILGSVGYSDAIFTDFDPNDTIEGDDLDGLRFSGPKFNTHLSVTHYTDLGDLGFLSTGVDYSYKSKSYGKFSNPEGTEFGSTSIVNARIAFESEENWEVALWVKNLLDKGNVIARQADSNLALFNIDLINYDAPRTFGATFTYNFY